MRVGGCVVCKRLPEVHVLMLGGEGVSCIRRIQRRTARKFAQHYGFEVKFDGGLASFYGSRESIRHVLVTYRKVSQIKLLSLFLWSLARFSEVRDAFYEVQRFDVELLLLAEGKLDYAVLIRYDDTFLYDFTQFGGFARQNENACLIADDQFAALWFRLSPRWVGKDNCCVVFSRKSRADSLARLIAYIFSSRLVGLRNRHEVLRMVGSVVIEDTNVNWLDRLLRPIRVYLVAELVKE